MKRFRKLFTAVTSTILCASMLAGCGGSTAPAGGGGEAAPAPAPETAAEAPAAETSSTKLIKVGIINNDPNE